MRNLAHLKGECLCGKVRYEYHCAYENTPKDKMIVHCINE